MAQSDGGLRCSSRMRRLTFRRTWRHLRMANDSKPPPRYRSSAEMTAVVPRDRLPPPSASMIATLDPSHPETREMLVRASDGHEEMETLIPCPGPCRTCECCHGARMVTADRAAEYLRSVVPASHDSPHDPEAKRPART
jgi:hypothetical protein